MDIRRRWVAASGVMVVAAGTLVVPPLAGPVWAAIPPAVDDDDSVAGNAVPALAEELNPAEDDTQVTSVEPVTPVWPGAASAVVDVPVPAGRLAPAEVAPTAAVAGVSVLADGAAAAALPLADPEFGQAGPGPVSMSPPATLDGLVAGGVSRVQVAGRSRALAQQLGVAQVFTLERVDGSSESAAVDVRVDYSVYAEAFGGSYADRLRLVRLPACALTMPELPACSAVPVPVQAVNNPTEQTLTARVPISADLSAGPRLLAQLGEPAPSSETVFAVTSSGGSGSSGDYTATDLSPGGTWQVGLSSGSFTYEYPIPEPPLLAGDGLGLSLGYDSQSVDAFTQSTNHQSGGWDWGGTCRPGISSGSSGRAARTSGTGRRRSVRISSTGVTCAGSRRTRTTVRATRPTTRPASCTCT